MTWASGCPCSVKPRPGLPGSSDSPRRGSQRVQRLRRRHRRAAVFRVAVTVDVHHRCLVSRNRLASGIGVTCTENRCSSMITRLVTLLRSGLLAASIAILLSGCSLVLVDEPRQTRPPGAAVPPTVFCTTERLVPVLDFVGALSFGVLAAHVDPADRVMAVPLLGIATAQTVSGVKGLRRVNACRDATATHPPRATTPVTVGDTARWLPAGAVFGAGLDILRVPESPPARLPGRS